MWAIQARTEARPKAPEGLSTFPRPEPKKIIYEKAPQGCCGTKSDEPGPAPTAGSVGSVVNPGPEPKTRMQRE